jgi:arabinose-5-phosphate isomerase
VHQPGDAHERAHAAALEAIEVEAKAVAVLAERIGSEFDGAVSLILGRRGRVIVSGLGKTGHIGRKLAATLASTGTTAFFIHAAEALHGDSGMAHEDDVAILISNSGTTAEVCGFGRMLKTRGIPIIAMTGRLDSELAGLADITLDVSVVREGDPLNLAPTASTVAALAMGDALACGLMAARGFGSEDFAARHPGGALGASLRTEG